LEGEDKAEMMAYENFTAHMAAHEQFVNSKK